MEEARRLVHDAFASDLLNAASSPEPLIEKLVTASGQTEDPARSYALLLEAEQAAVAAGKPDRAMELVAIRSREFTIDPIQARAALLEELFTAQARRDQGALASLFGHAVETARLGIERESLKQAAAAAELSGNAAKALYLLGKAKKADSLAKDGENKQRQASELLEQIGDRAKLLAEFVRAQATLKDSPEDPDGNETVGSYLCFCRGDWEAGLAALVKSGDKSLAEVAALEQAVMAAEPPDPNQLFGLAGKWWEISQGRDEPAARRHAAALYGECLADLADPVEKALASTRMNSIATKDMPMVRKLVDWEASADGGASAAVNLLAGVDLQRSSVMGRWNSDGNQGGAVSFLPTQGTPNGILELPGKVPGDYEFTIGVRVAGGRGHVVVIVAHEGSSRHILLGNDHCENIQLKPGSRIHFPAGRQTKVKVVMRRGVGGVFLNDEEVGRVVFNNIKNLWWKPRHPGLLGVGSHETSLVVDEASVRSLSN